MPKVTVIIPVYNSELYIGRCLESVMNQILTDIEIICIDDCSTDFSANLLEQYAKLDERIKILHNDKNSGQAFSRNKALEFARGEYIQFLDSDDCLSGDDVLGFLYSVSIKNRLDLLKSKWILIENEVEKKAVPYPECTDGNVCSGKELLYQLEYHNICAWSTWTNFVRLDFLIESGINFYNGIIHEDVLYSFDLLYFANRAMCINRYSYLYFKHPNSTTTKPKDINHLRGYLVCMNEIMKKNFMQDSIKFRYATVKYFIRMYNIVLSFKTKMNCSIEPAMLDDTLQTAYKLFWEKNYIKIETIIQNINTIVQSEKIYIYGAGKAAKELLEILAEYDISIDGIFVTDIKKSSRTLMGHKVFSIDMCHDSKEKALFLVAITKIYVGDTLDLLHSRGYGNVIYVCEGGGNAESFRDSPGI